MRGHRGRCPGGQVAAHRLGDVGLAPVGVLQGVVLRVGQAPPARTRSQAWSQDGPGHHRPVGHRSPPVTTRWATTVPMSRYSRVADVLEHGGQRLGLRAREREDGGERAAAEPRGSAEGGPGGTCWSSMSWGMAPTIWMAIFTTSLGGGMAPAAAPAKHGPPRLPAAVPGRCRPPRPWEGPGGPRGTRGWGPGGWVGGWVGGPGWGCPRAEAGRAGVTANPAREGPGDTGSSRRLWKGVVYSLREQLYKYYRQISFLSEKKKKVV